MVLRLLLFFLSVLLISACSQATDIKDLNKEEINQIMSGFDTADPIFINKDLKFDSIITLAGSRSLGEKKEQVKCKLFFFGSYARGYFNLSDRDDKNLQVFGKREQNKLTLKSATKINMEESDGYILLDSNYEGIWSNGSVNFEKGIINLKKQSTDYTELKSW